MWTCGLGTLHPHEGEIAGRIAPYCVMWYKMLSTLALHRTIDMKQIWSANVRLSWQKAKFVKVAKQLQRELSDGTLGEKNIKDRAKTLLEEEGVWDADLIRM